MSKPLFRLMLLLAVISVWAFSTLSTQASPQRKSPIPPDLKALVGDAYDLADDLDWASCNWIRQHNIPQKAGAIFLKLLKFYQQAQADGATDLADYIEGAGNYLYESLDYFYEDCGPPISGFQFKHINVESNVRKLCKIRTKVRA